MHLFSYPILSRLFLSTIIRESLINHLLVLFLPVLSVDAAERDETFIIIIMPSITRVTNFLHSFGIR